MALCRCLKHPPKGYQCYVFPIGYHDGYVFPIGYHDDTALICGRSGCDEPAVIWLKDNEVQQYRQQGKRIFEGPTNVTKMKADNRGVKCI